MSGPVYPSRLVGEYQLTGQDVAITDDFTTDRFWVAYAHDPAVMAQHANRLAHEAEASALPFSGATMMDDEIPMRVPGGCR